MVSIQLKDEKEIEKRKVLVDFIEKYFDYSKEGLATIKDQIFNPKIDEVYAKFFNDDTLRKHFELPSALYEGEDEGWIIFKKYFAKLISDFNITYSEFSQNTFTNGKNKVKIFKFLGSLDKESEYLKKVISFDFSQTPEVNLKQISEQIGKYKISDKNKKKIVISCNPVDFMLVSSAESWSSCLNLNSNYGSCYWAGLPAMINDKNRAIIYETDGNKKSLLSLSSERFLSRSWSILSDKDEMIAIRFFPGKHFGNATLSDVIGNSVKEIYRDFISKYPVEPIYNDAGFSLGIYLDNCHVEEDHKYHEGSSGFQSTHIRMIEKKYYGFSLYSMEGGINNLNKYNEKISNYRYYYVCKNCGKELKKADDFRWEADKTNCFCEPCYSKIFINCSHCGSGIKSNDSFEFNGKKYCSSCKNRLFDKCEYSNEFVLKTDLEKITIAEISEEGEETKTYNIYKKYIQKFLKEKGYFKCDDCGKIYKRDIEIDNFVIMPDLDYLCFDCHCDLKQFKFDFAA